MAPSIYTCTLVDTFPNPDEHHHHPNLTTPTLSMANSARSAPSPSPSTSPEPSAHSAAAAAVVSVERLVLDICHRERRGMAMQILAKVMKRHEDVALTIWHSRSTMAALIQEIVSIYRYLSPPRLSMADSTRVCYALALLKCVASHRETRTPFLQAGIPLYVYPFLNTSSVEKPIEHVRLTSLGVIGALVKYDDAVAINFLIQTELLPLCLRAMEMGTLLSKTVATLIVQKVLMDEVGLQHVCSTAERFYSVCDVLAFMVTSRTEPPSMRLLKYIILCYRRLSENLRASFCLNDRLPKELRDGGEFIECLRNDPEAMSCLWQLLQNMAAAAFQARQQGGVNYTIRSWR